jgi:hypothetical protein
MPVVLNGETTDDGRTQHTFMSSLIDLDTQVLRTYVVAELSVADAELEVTLDGTHTLALFHGVTDMDDARACLRQLFVPVLADALLVTELDE